MRQPRFRFSLLTVLLLGTIAAMAVTMWRNGKDLVPLRAELMDLRAELGYFRVDQPERIAVQESDVVTGKAWRWRVHLPVNKQYRLHYRLGSWPEVDLKNKTSWLPGIMRAGSSNDLPVGQFTLNVSLESFDGKWFLRYAYANQIQGIVELKTDSDWLSDLLSHQLSSEARVGELQTFDAADPVILIHVRENSIRPGEQGTIVEKTTGIANSLVLWISAR